MLQDWKFKVLLIKAKNHGDFTKFPQWYDSPSICPSIHHLSIHFILFIKYNMSASVLSSDWLKQNDMYH